jgi:hypothetical protein
MANRRGRHSIQNILNGESDFEREERYSQKKDYAAALQEQVFVIYYNILKYLTIIKCLTIILPDPPKE